MRKLLPIGVFVIALATALSIAAAPSSAPVGSTLGFPRLYYLWQANGAGAFNTYLYDGCNGDILKALSNFNTIELNPYWAGSGAVFPCGGTLISWLRAHGVANKTILMFWPAAHTDSTASNGNFGTLTNDVNARNLWMYDSGGTIIQAGNGGGPYLINGSDVITGPNPNSGYRQIAATEVAARWSLFDGARFDMVPYAYHQFLAGKNPDFNRDGQSDLCSGLQLGKTGMNASYYRGISSWFNVLKPSKIVAGNNLWVYRNIPQTGTGTLGNWEQPYATAASGALSEDWLQRDLFLENDGGCGTGFFDLRTAQRRWGVAVRAAYDWLRTAQDPQMFVALGTDFANHPEPVESFGRLALTSALLTDSYFAWCPQCSTGTYAWAAHWMEEFSVDPATGRLDPWPGNHMNWLGMPIGLAKDTNGDTIAIHANRMTAGEDPELMGTLGWMREFDKGLALANPSNASVTFTLPAGTWRRLAGGNTSANNGDSVVGTITIPARDGLILYRVSAPPSTATPAVTPTPPSATWTATPVTSTPTQTPTPTATAVSPGEPVIYTASRFGYIAQPAPGQNLVGIRSYTALDSDGLQVALFDWGTLRIGTDHSAGEIPPKAVIDEATLTVYAINRYGETLQAQAGQVLSSWPDTVNWNSFPLTSSVTWNGGGMAFTGVDTYGQPASVDVKAIVQAWANGSGQHGIALMGAGGGGVTYVLALRADLEVRWHAGSSSSGGATATYTPLPTATPAVQLALVVPTQIYQDPHSIPVQCTVANGGSAQSAAVVKMWVEGSWNVDQWSPASGAWDYAGQVTWTGQSVPGSSSQYYFLSLSAYGMTSTRYLNCSYSVKGWTASTRQALNVTVSTATSTSTASPTATGARVATNTPAPMPTIATSTPVPTFTLTPSITPSPTPSNTPTGTPPPTVTPSSTATPTATNTPTWTAIPSKTPTATQTNPPTRTPSATPRPTPTSQPYLLFNEAGIDIDVDFDGLPDDYLELWNGFGQRRDLSTCRFAVQPNGSTGFYSRLFPGGAYINAKSWLGIRTADLGFSLPRLGGAIRLECPDAAGLAYTLIDTLNIESADRFAGRAFARTWDGYPIWQYEQPSFASGNRP